MVIKEFSVTRFQLPEVEFRVVCTTGTYIRSLANDLGAALGCGGYLSALRRTRIGDHTVEQALTMDSAEEWINRQFRETRVGEGGASGGIE